MRTMHRLAAAAAAVALLGAGCSFGSKVDTNYSRTRDPNQPVAGDRVTITNCKADPSILQASSGTVVTFKNNDAADHKLFFVGNEVNVAAGGTATYRVTRPAEFGSNFTLNFNCDGQYAGAIFLP